MDGDFSLPDLPIGSFFGSMCGKFTYICQVIQVATILLSIVRGHQQHLNGSRFHSPSQKGHQQNCQGDKDILLMEEILHQLICNLSHYLQGFIDPRWCRISSINRITQYTVYPLVNQHSDCWNIPHFSHRKVTSSNSGSHLSSYGPYVDPRVVWVFLLGCPRKLGSKVRISRV